MSATHTHPSSSSPSSSRRLPGGLVRSSDTAPGIARQRRGKGFRYLRANGKPVTDEQELQRIRSLAIPPAYRQVWICPRPDGHLQATGVDARGRKQYRYHQAWREAREEDKFSRLPDFAAALPRLRRRVARDLSMREHGRAPLLATVVRLLDTTLGRIGNDQYARENGSYGLTTLCDHHVRLAGQRLELQFRGKSGVEQSLCVEDPRVARVVRRCLGLPGRALFRYLGEDGAPHCVGSAEVNDYLQTVGGAGFSAKYFRTWHASVLALDLTVRALQRQQKFTLRQLLAEVSGVLGNTPAVCRRSYIHPRVVALATLAARKPDAAREWLARCAPDANPAGLRRTERRLLAFLACCHEAPLVVTEGARARQR